MAVIEVYEKSRGLAMMEDLYAALEGRIGVSAPTSCPVEFASAFAKLAVAQSCGKCTPCRVGLVQLGELIDGILDGYGVPEDIDLITELAESIYYSADCAIGYEAAAVALRSIKGFKDDYLFHIEHNNCGADSFAPVPCVAACPAGVDIPGYLALTAAGRYNDALSLIRKDNPFAVACGMICEHPCELQCRRGMMDDPINIRGIKRYAADHCDANVLPAKAAPTGKRIAVIGGGPSGLSAAYFLALMGHEPVVFDRRSQLGGMLRYGIPAYRLPRDILQAEIDFLLSAGITVETGIRVGEDLTIAELAEQYDAVYLSIGAHKENRLGLEGEDAEGVFSAIDILYNIGGDEVPDFNDKDVIVVGGGNVAMDVARTALRMGSKSVRIVYRRRVMDMTAQAAEIDAAKAEGCILQELVAPVGIELADGKVCGLKVQPQMVGAMPAGGRPAPVPLDEPAVTLACDALVLAIGQVIDYHHFEAAGFKVERGRFVAAKDGSAGHADGIFVGGDCSSGPATAILAIAAGKAAARSIDTYLGFDHSISVDVEIPSALPKGKAYCARANMIEVLPQEIAGDYSLVECGFSDQEAQQEANRCLRCDHFGLAALRGGRSFSW
ncbi:MAG: NAD(P)-binding protein [Coriobacteriia bacterium]|nr:NAD(P)-binding protein [Coriobacteriia bacterium]